jgi:peptidyl-prolyl cis-trans isomerase SurA
MQPLRAHILCLLLVTPLLIQGVGSLAFASPQGDVVIDAVVATVDDKPITLSELSARLAPPRKLSLTEAARDAEALKALDALIFEKLIEEEAVTKRITTTDSDIEDYLNEVASRNGLSRKDFEKALAAEGRTLEAYKQQVRLDILRTRLASAMTRGGVSISDKEVDEYIESHPELLQSGETVKLRQIVVSSSGRDSTALEARSAEILKALDDGEKFADVASRFSEGPHASDGGLIGIVAAKDLSEDISSAISSLDPGEWSSPVESEAGIQIFFVEQRFDGSEEGENSASDAVREEVRQSLQQQKSQEKLSSFFSNELYKNHAVDKKL